MLHAAFWSRCRIWRLRLHQRPSVAKSAFRVLATANRSNRISGCFFLFLLTLCFFLLHLTTPFLQLDKRSTFAVTPWARLRRVVLGCIYNHKLLRQPSAKPDTDAGCYSFGNRDFYFSIKTSLHCIPVRTRRNKQSIPSLMSSCTGRRFRFVEYRFSILCCNSVL